MVLNGIFGAPAHETKNMTIQILISKPFVVFIIEPLLI
jgi:hypothetical protein